MHSLVSQLQFTRSEFLRGLEGVTPEDALRSIEPMNCLSWMVGHLAAQEQLYWLTQTQGITPAPEVKVCATGQPACSPPLEEMLAAWKLVTSEADKFLAALDSADLTQHTLNLAPPHEPYRESVGTRLLRTTYHYWYHTGESQAVRQLLGHQGVGQFVGDIGGKAPYTPDVS